MCGRFNIISDPLTRFIMDIVNGELGPFELETQYNIAPTEPVPVLGADAHSMGQMVALANHHWVKADSLCAIRLIGPQLFYNARRFQMQKVC